MTTTNEVSAPLSANKVDIAEEILFERGGITNVTTAVLDAMVALFASENVKDETRFVVSFLLERSLDNGSKVAAIQLALDTLPEVHAEGSKRLDALLDSLEEDE